MDKKSKNNPQSEPDNNQDNEAQQEEQVLDEQELNNSSSNCACATCDEKNLDYRDSYLRAVADYDNLRKETVRLRGEYAKYAAVEVVGQLLPVWDNLKKALNQQPDSDSYIKWVEGISLISEQFSRIMNAAGVTVIDQVDIPFDPSVHEALMRENRQEVEPDMVIKIIEPGYRLHDRVLRPAKVIVSE